MKYRIVWIVLATMLFIGLVPAMGEQVPVQIDAIEEAQPDIALDGTEAALVREDAVGSEITAMLEPLEDTAAEAAAGANALAPRGISISPRKKTVTVGKKFTIKVKGTSKKVTFSSSNKKIAKVSKKGVVTALKAGSAKITIKVGGRKKGTCKVTVKKASAARTDLTRYFGTDVKKVASKLGLHWEYTGYSNDYIHIRTDNYDTTGSTAVVGIDTRTSKYSVAGVYLGMTRGKATSHLKSKGWRLKYNDTSYPGRVDTYYANPSNGWELAFVSDTSSSSSLITYVAAVSWEGAWS